MCSSKNFLNNELFLLSFPFSSFLFEENFKILKGIIILKHNVRQIKIIIITRKKIYIMLDYDISKTATKKKKKKKKN